jgi:hypothetical protein
MKHIVRKAYWDYEKEEKYLNEMSAKGFALIDYSWCRYVFEEAPKGQYIYRLELLENPVTHPESQNYIKFMEETGAEFVVSYMRWVYFRKKAADGEFNIYSDIDSKINHYKRILVLFFAVMAMNLFPGLTNLILHISESTKGTGSFNIYSGIPSISVGMFFLIFLVMPLTKKIYALKKEKSIRE